MHFALTTSFGFEEEERLGAAVEQFKEADELSLVGDGSSEVVANNNVPASLLIIELFVFLDLFLDLGGHHFVQLVKGVGLIAN